MQAVGVESPFLDDGLACTDLHGRMAAFYQDQGGSDGDALDDEWSTGLPIGEVHPSPQTSGALFRLKDGW